MPILVTIILGLSGCLGWMVSSNKPVDTFNTVIYYPQYPDIAVAFQKEVFEFERLARIYGQEKLVQERLPLISVQFGNTKSIGLSLKGVCFHKEKAILIDKTAWSKFSDLQRQTIITHELGHCVLGRIHRYKKDKNIAVSLMTPLLTDAVISYNKDSEGLMKELFNPDSFNQFEKYNSVLGNFYEQHPELVGKDSLGKERLSEDLKEELSKMFSNIVNDDSDISSQK